MDVLEYRARGIATGTALAVGVVAFALIDGMQSSALWMIPIVLATWLGARALALHWFRTGQ